MFHRIAGRGARPLWNNVSRANKRDFWSTKGEIPIYTSRRTGPMEGMCKDYMNRKHGAAGVREFEQWRNMIERYMQPRTYGGYWRPRYQRYAEDAVRPEMEKVRHPCFSVSVMKRTYRSVFMITYFKFHVFQTQA